MTGKNLQMVLFGIFIIALCILACFELGVEKDDYTESWECVEWSLLNFYHVDNKYSQMKSFEYNESFDYYLEICTIITLKYIDNLYSSDICGEKDYRCNFKLDEGNLSVYYWKIEKKLDNDTFYVEYEGYVDNHYCRKWIKVKELK